MKLRTALNNTLEKFWHLCSLANTIQMSIYSGDCSPELYEGAFIILTQELFKITNMLDAIAVRLPDWIEIKNSNNNEYIQEGSER